MRLRQILSLSVLLFTTNSCTTSRVFHNEPISNPAEIAASTDPGFSGVWHNWIPCETIHKNAVVAYNITKIFETGSDNLASYGTVAGNYDGQGISFGAHQFNYGQGTIQILMSTFVARFSQQFSNAVKAANFEGQKESFLKSITLQGQDAVKYLVKNDVVRTDGSRYVAPNWQKFLQVIGTQTGMIETQRVMAGQYVWEALREMRLLNFNTRIRLSPDNSIVGFAASQQI